MRGRKKIDGALREVISIRITEQQKDVLDKNKWIKRELDKMIREYIDIYIVKNDDLKKTKKII